MAFLVIIQRSKKRNYVSPSIPSRGNMLGYHILPCISLGDGNTHVRIYCNTSKNDKIRQTEKNRGKIEPRTLGLGLPGRGPAKKKRKKGNDIPMYPEENHQV